MQNSPGNRFQRILYGQLTCSYKLSLTSSIIVFFQAFQISNIEMYVDVLN